MKEIWNAARLDFIMIKPIMLPAYLLVCAMAVVMGLFFSPMMAFFLVITAPLLVVSLKKKKKKYGFHKLYGILPVHRKNITRGRFLYLYLSHFIPELAGLLLVRAAITFQLWRLLPGVTGDIKSMIEETFDPQNMSIYTMLAGLFIAFCLLFSYMQMMGQIFGVENEMKIVMITLAVVTVGALAFFWLSDHEIIPRFQIPDLSALTPAQAVRFILIDNLAALAGNVVFCEITAAKVSQREL